MGNFNDNLEKYKLLCEQNYTREEIAKKLNVTTRTITNYKKITNVNPKRKISLDDTYFKKIDTEEKAYILGFVYADGYIDGKEKSLGIDVNKRDIDILYKIKEATRCKNDLHKSSTENCVRLYLCSKKMVNDLKNVGVYRNKTKTIRMPLLEDELYRHFMRGYCDGDGHVGLTQTVIVTGSEQFHKDMVSLLENKFKMKMSTRKQGNTWYLVLSRKDLCIVEWMYDNCSIYLDRKYNSYIENWVSYAEKKRTKG